MSKERGKDSLSEMSLSEKQSVRSGSHVFSSVFVKSDCSKGLGPNIRDKTTSSKKRLQCVTLDSDFQTCRDHNVKDLLWIFQDLEGKIFTFLKNQLEKFKKLLQKENTQCWVNDFNENRCRTKEAALDLTLYFLREMKQDEAADILEDNLVFIHQLKCGLKKKYQCVFEGIAKQGDSILLNIIYTDLYITQGCSEQVNTEHEVRQIEVASRRHESQEIPIECKNLFEAPEQDNEIRTVLTKGVAGIGKSVSVQRFVLDWAEGKENQDISFIFPLPFRELNLMEKEKQSLMDLINHFFPEIKGLNLTRRNNFKVLFILDGLDECRLPLNFDGNETWRDVSSPASLDVLLTNLIKGNLLPSALIWITTRPAAASKIPPDYIDRVTEIRGFSDAQKEEYFKKRFIDDNLSKEILDHVKKSKSLFIMCHIPVFCWISATVLQNILEIKTDNNQQNNQADDASKTLQESNTVDTPKTLTQMYTHFLRFQIQQSRRKYDGDYTPDVSWDKDAILSLGKLAFYQLERNNLIFYDTDLEACGIDVYTASVYSGMCTQIFKEETGIILGTMYCFVHLSIQEFIAALYAHLFLDINKKSVFVQSSMEQKSTETMIELLKTAVDNALESDSGHLDLFLRFLLGLSLQSNRLLLRGLLTQEGCNDQIKKEIVEYIKQKLEDNLSPERSINLFYCLNELNDQTLVKEIQTHLSKGLSSSDLSPAQWSALAFVLLTSEEEMEEFELQKFKKSDECLIRLSAVIKTSKRALLNDCSLTDRCCSALVTVLGSDTSLKVLNMNNNNLQDSGVKLLCTGLKNIICKLEILSLSMCDLTEESCSALASVLSSDSSSLKDLDLSNNNLQDSGVKLLSDGLKKCKLEKLRLSDCSITEEGYKALASALRSNPSHLVELDLTGNDPGQSGVKELSDLLQDPNCQLKKLTFLGPAADEAFQYVTEIVGKNPLLLRELNLSGRKLGETRVNQIAALLQDKHCKLNTLILSNDNITEEGCAALTLAFDSNHSNLIELDLSGNTLGKSGMMKICCLLKNTKSRLMKLKLSDCSITEEGYKALASALRSNPSHLIELDLTGNDPGQSGVKELSDFLQEPNCQLKTLRFLCPEADEACRFVTGIVGKNLLLLSELNLSGHHLGDTRVSQISALLQDKHCQLSTLILCGCKITEKQLLILTSALKSNPSHLRELNLSGNKLKDSGAKNLSDLLMNPQCKLEKLELCGCKVTEKQCFTLTSALNSNPSHLRELDLSENKIKNTGVKHLCDILKDPDCKLEKLSLHDCGITDLHSLIQSLTNTKALQFLKELDLSYNMIGDSKQQLIDVLQGSNCKLLEKEHWLTASLSSINLS
ncbi:NACHT, LRR and PYD domains-containing protein 12-like [Carassius carassius]|uniref:NACHT, LRR and PYD domains-containing protein 12-like n=1 Tax=Carassius carassius TaxID=217509 RepID=UPI0028685502|nr:NACHT, LRR and PYD domains-containing protein 12-like [Carassius carassius]